MQGSGEEILKEGGHLEELDVDGSIILKWILNKMGENELDLSGSGIGRRCRRIQTQQ
jgi:hypothetical protein